MAPSDNEMKLAKAAIAIMARGRSVSRGVDGPNYG